jgi:serine/threonine protein kinase
MTENTEPEESSGESPSPNGNDVSAPAAGGTPLPPPPPPPPPAPAETVASSPSSGSAKPETKTFDSANMANSAAWAAASTPGSASDSNAESGEIGETVDTTRADLGGANQTGRRLGDFQLEKKIGQGGMGEVYKARQISLDRPVAVKVLTRGLASQPGFVERFQREAKAAANIVHPHVIQIYAYGIDNGTPYFAMEYVEGEDLQQRMRRVKRLPIEEIIDTMIAVASALGAAHEKNLIHRDVKPSNVMIDRQGNVKVMDFGLAKAASSDGSLTQSGVIMGTPNYLSPEQGRGDPIDGRADLYSLGVVMYELFAGDLPFRADTPAGLIFKHVYEEAPSLRQRNASVPPFVEEIVHKLLKKDPADRYQSGKELVADLHEFMDGQDHYMQGGARRAKAPTSSSRVRAPVPVVTDGAETIFAPLSPGDAPTEAVPREPTPTGTIDRPASVTIIREQPSQAPIWVGLLVLVLGGGAFVAWQSGLLQKIGVGSRRVSLTIAAADVGLAESVHLNSKDDTVSLDVKPGIPVRLEAGVYVITGDKKGYKPFSSDVTVKEENGQGVLAFPGSGWRFEPLPEMADFYTRGAAALEHGKQTSNETDLVTARDALANVADPGFKPDAGAKTARELLADATDAIAQAKRLASDADALLKAKSWQKLRELIEPLKADPRWAVYYDQATHALEHVDTGVAQVEAERDKGNLDAALAALAVVEKDEPENPRVRQLRPELEDLKKKKESGLKLAASAQGRAELEAAAETLASYVDAVKGDAAAAQALEALRAKLKNDLSAPLAAAIKQRDWPKADTLWTQLKQSDPHQPGLAAWRAAIDLGLREKAVREAVSALDAAMIVAPSGRSVARLLDATSPDMVREQTAFDELPDAGARIVASKHTIDSVQVEAAGNAFAAHVDATWNVSFEVDGERSDLQQRQRIGLRLVGSDWKFTSFVTIDPQKAGQGNK